MAVSSKNSSEIASKYTRFLLKEINNDRLSRGRETPWATEVLRDFRDLIIYSLGSYFTNRHHVSVRSMHLLTVIARNKESHYYLLDDKFNTLKEVVEAMKNPINENNTYFQNYANEFIQLIYTNCDITTRNQIDNLLQDNNINQDKIMKFERYSLSNYYNRWNFIWQVPLGSLITAGFLYPALAPATKNSKYWYLLLGASSIPSIYYTLNPQTVNNIFNTVSNIPFAHDLSTMPILRSILICASTASVLAGTMYPYYFIGPYIVHKLDRMYHFTNQDYKWDEVNQISGDNKQ